MSKPWTKVKLGEVLRRVERFEPRDELTEYPFAGTYSFARGIFVGERKLGSTFALPKIQRVKRGDFVYCKIMAWEGAFGLVPTEADNCVMSGAFVAYELNRDRIDERFLDYFFKMPAHWQSIGSQSSGTNVRRQSLHPTQFESAAIPLPPLAEQRRVVARIEELAAQIHEARALRQQATEEAEALFASSISSACSGKRVVSIENVETARQLLDRIAATRWPGQVHARKRKPILLPLPPELPPSWTTIEAGELQELGAILDIQDGNHGGGYPRKSEFEDVGVPFVTAKQFDNGTVRISEAPRLAHERAARLRIGFAKANDVLLTHNASVGDVAIAPSDAGDFLLGTSATYWRCNPEALEPRYLFYFMRSEFFQGQLQSIMKQTTRNQVSVLKQVNLWICVPPLPNQRRIVAELDALQAEVDALKRLQAETAAELDALLPAILDRAFRGELTDGAPIIDLRSSPEFLRAVLAAEIVHEMRGSGTFGQTKLQKIIFLVEYVAELPEIDSRPRRFPRGPHDPELINIVERKMSELDWFRTVRRSGHAGRAYAPLAQAGRHREILERQWPDKVTVIRRLIAQMMHWKTQRCERVATVYAAWNDLLHWGHEVSDDAILHEVLKRWHPKKLKIPRQTWRETIDWLREQRFTPRGFGHATAGVPQPELLDVES